MEGSSADGEAVLVGGPRDGATVDPGGAAVVEFEIGAFVHRYILTTKVRERGDQAYQVFTYDGEHGP